MNDAPEVLRTVIKAAKGGCVQSANILLQRALPTIKAQAEPVKFAVDANAPLTDQARQILSAIAAGEIDPNTGKMLLDSQSSSRASAISFDIGREAMSQRFINRAEGLDIKEPAPWPPDGGARRVAVTDPNFKPARIVRHVGHARCLSCARWFFSQDVIRVRICGMCKSYKTE